MAEPTLLNNERPPVFCPGCSHDRILKILDQVFVSMGLAGHDVAMVSDIGCSGLFDTFFNTHALHGVHGRALTYATGLKLSQPDLNVVVTMGDGGLGIGGAHVLSACRRNLDLTLLVLNNFNFGMTGGQCSVTSPNDAVLGSGFLNRLDKPMELYDVAVAAGAPFVARCSAYQKNLPDIMERAIRFKGFSVVEIQGICPGRYTKRNKLTPDLIAQRLAEHPVTNGEIPENARAEYGEAYRRESGAAKPVQRPKRIEARLAPPEQRTQAISILGSAGQGIVTAGEVLGLACLHGGLHVTQKNEYNITVLRGPSITDINVSPNPIDYTGSADPDVVVAMAAEGVERRRRTLENLSPESWIIQSAGVALPPTRAKIITVDFKQQQIKKQDWALAALVVLAKMNRVISVDMLMAGLAERFRGPALESTRALVDQVQM